MKSEHNFRIQNAVVNARLFIMENFDLVSRHLSKLIALH